MGILSLIITTSLSGDFSYRRNDDHYRHFEGGTTEKSPPNLALTLFEIPIIFRTAKSENEAPLAGNTAEKLA